MDRFDDNEYSRLIGDLLHDIYYINTSNSGKLNGLRKHAEVMVRKILDVGSSKRLMLGEVSRNSRNSAIKSGMEKLGDELSERLIEIVERVRPLGNYGSHTQHTNEFSQEEVESVEDAILDLYALIFIKFFIDIDINIYSSAEVLSMFSLLPPVIRYKTWSYLFEKNTNNIQVVDKLCLSIIKFYDKKKAYEWLENNEETIKEISYPTKREIEKYNRMHMIETEPGNYDFYLPLNFNAYENMYDLLLSKISDSMTNVNESGKLYKSFEETIDYYEEVKFLMMEENSVEMKTLLSLMDFVYLGRKSKGK